MKTGHLERMTYLNLHWHSALLCILHFNTVNSQQALLRADLKLHLTNAGLEISSHHQAATLGRRSINAGVWGRDRSDPISGIWSDSAADYRMASKFAEIILSNWVGHQSTKHVSFYIFVTLVYLWWACYLGIIWHIIQNSSYF